ncbi:transposase family protein, partial [Paracraurococcus ruber]
MPGPCRTGGCEGGLPWAGVEKGLWRRFRAGWALDAGVIGEETPAMPLLDPRPLLPSGLVVDTVETGADRITISAHPAATVSACPICGELSRRVHSRYRRRLLDLPSHGRAVELHLQVRRFRCVTAECPQRTFA